MCRGPGAGAAFAVIAAFALLPGAGPVQARLPALRWSPPVKVDVHGGGLAAIACPSAHVCFAVDNRSHVLASGRPTAGARGWWRTGARVAGRRYRDSVGRWEVPGTPAIACAGRALCVVVERTPELFVSSAPAGGFSAWKRVPADAHAAITSVACPSANLCVAVDDSGDVLTSTHPAGGGAWQQAPVDPAADNGEGGIYAVSCPSLALCIAVDDQGNVLRSTDPAAGAPSWSVTPVYTGIGSAGGLLDVSCSSEALCVAVDGTYGDVVLSTNPDAAQPGWRAGGAISPAINETIEGRLDFVHCDFNTLCVAGDNLGNTYTSSDPTGGEAAWSTSEFEVAAVSCPAPSLCVAVEAGGEVRLGRPPQRHAWPLPARSAAALRGGDRGGRFPALGRTGSR